LDPQPTNLQDGEAQKSFQFPWKVCLGFVFMAGFLWLAFRRTPMGDLISHLKKVSPLAVAGAIGLHLISIALRGWRWKIMLSPSDPGLKRRHAVIALLVGYAVNVVIPRGGEVARAVFLRRIARTSLVAGLSSVIAERLLDVVFLCILFFLTVSFYQHHLEAVFPGVGKVMFIAAIFAAVGLAGAWLISRNPAEAAGWLRRILDRVWPSRAERFLVMGENFITGIGGLFVRESAVRIFLLSVGIWVLSIFSVWWVAEAFSAGKLSSLSFLDAAAITVVVVISISLPAPGGTGTTHYFVSMLLTGLYGISPAEALAFATLLHLVGVIPSLLLGGLCSLIAPSAGPAENTSP
jgi:uncharacterized protein (TIRG00374 family)